jgi:hypothetical protein
MRSILRAVTVLAATGLLTFGSVSAAQALPRLSVDVWGSVSAEYRKTCSNAEPWVCGTYTNVASFTIVTYGQHTPVTVYYQFEPGTATEGVDYTGPYTGSVTIQPNFPQAWVSVPVVNDGVPEPDETVFLRITGVSERADIGPRDNTLIFDGGNIPVDCDLTRDFDTSSITCSNRAAGDQWRVSTRCDRGADWPNEWTRFYTVAGNIVTGNGTSTVTCPDGQHSGGPNFADL